jgi:heme/copper-type cytochrome/quinol oxidase subunit 2
MKSKNFRYRRGDEHEEHHDFLIAASVGYLHQEAALRSSAHEMRSDEPVIHISASTSEFTPNEITVKKGVPVTLELISQDRHHGFNLSYPIPTRLLHSAYFTNTTGYLK